MPRENGDLFDRASLRALRPENELGYVDLLEIQSATEDPDAPMPDFQEEQDTSLMLYEGTTPKPIKFEDPHEEFPWTTTVDTMISLIESDSDSEQPKDGEAQFEEKGTVVKQEPDDTPFPWVNVPEAYISLLDDDEEQTQEPMDLANTEDRIVESLDSDDDIEIVQDDGTTVPIKMEAEEVEYLWTEMDDGVIDLPDSEEEPAVASKIQLGESILGRPNARARPNPEQLAKIQQAQRLYAESLSRKPMNPRSQGNFGGRDSRPENDDDGNAWMTSRYKPEDTAEYFLESKRVYIAKKKASTNTVQDDFNFAKAQKVEAARKKRLHIEYLNALGPADEDGDDDTDLADESDDGLFLHSSSPQRSKRTRAGGDARSPKKRKENGPHQQTRTDLDKDLEWNMMAGIEGFLADRKEKLGAKASKNPGKGKQNDKKKASSKGKTATPSYLKESKKRPNQAGYLNNSGSLMTSDVLRDANANSSTNPQPLSSETNKIRALAAMVAGLPQHDIRRQEKNSIKKATVTLGHSKVTANGKGDWAYKGMKSSLRHHQVQGAAFMKERETGIHEPYGGILADGMGLGKTVQIITLMISNPPTRAEKYKSTLIVCTPSLLTQWETELEKHAHDEAFGRIIRHHSGNRLSGKGAVEDMQRANVVYLFQHPPCDSNANDCSLTTYGEVVKSYPKIDLPEEMDDVEKVKEWWKEVWQQSRDILHKARFYRVVLDESQAIKNHLTQTSVACRALMAKHRWALSGTPIMNRLEEFYPYFKFLRIECTGSFAEFQERFCLEGSIDCHKRLHCLLDQIMIRRTFGDKILGNPIVKLPNNHQVIEQLEFNIVERYIYDIVSRRFIRAINKEARKEDLEKTLGCGLVMLLRLRQMAAHIFLIQEILQEMFTMDSIDRLEAAAVPEGTADDQSKNLIAALRRMVEAKGDAQAESPREEPSPAPLGGLAIKLGAVLRKLRADAKLVEYKKAVLCHKCNYMPDEPYVTSCLHVYCKECLNFLSYEAASSNDQDRTHCQECGTIFATSQPCEGLKELEFDDFSDLTPNSRGRDKRGKVNMNWVAYDDKLILSAKTQAVQNQIEKWLSEAPEQKIIVFSQFHMIMRIIEGICQRQEWEYCTYNGKMSHKARDETVRKFGAKDSKIKVMISSLMCGGIGLNLAMASRVTCVDLWFNSCVEQQAFCRVFRIGQESETFVTRFIINKSVDDRLERMQKHKDRVISTAMDDSTVASKLSAQDVMRLFGEVKFDKKTKKPYIAMDEDERLDAILPPLSDDEGDEIAWRK